jgi:LacI family transcriptional regulator
VADLAFRREQRFRHTIVIDSEAMEAVPSSRATFGLEGPGGFRVTTIKDVAAHAGVGIGTVSRVLNDHPAVTDETRAKVRQAIETLDYHPSRVARALSRQRSGSVAVVVPFFTHPSVVVRLRGVLRVFDESPYEVILFNVDHAEFRPSRFDRLTRRDLADGVLVMSLAPTADETRRLVASSIPVVVVDADSEAFPHVVVDDVAGGRLAAQHLLDLGHQRIGYVGDRVDQRFGFTSSVRRRRGLADALAAAGLRLDPRDVREGPHGRAGAHELALDLLGSPDRPTAVFAHSDSQALGVLGAATLLGLRVPEDVSVMGFDDLEAAELAGLSTVRQPLYDSGRIGATELLELLQGAAGAEVPHRLELPLEVVARTSTGPVSVTAGPRESASRQVSRQ